MFNSSHLKIENPFDECDQAQINETKVKVKEKHSDAFKDESVFLMEDNSLLLELDPSQKHSMRIENSKTVVKEIKYMPQDSENRTSRVPVVITLMVLSIIVIGVLVVLLIKLRNTERPVEFVSDVNAEEDADNYHKYSSVTDGSAPGVSYHGCGHSRKKFKPEDLVTYGSLEDEADAKRATVV